MAILIVLLIVLIVAFARAEGFRFPWSGRHGRHEGPSLGLGRQPLNTSGGAAPSPPASLSPTAPPDDQIDLNYRLGDSPERRSVYSALGRLYSTADVDPLVTGQLYGYTDNIRNVYAERTSHGDIHGLTEYSSSGSPGDVGVDVGPFGLNEYAGRQIGFDDGIPETWAFPSTPVRWYGPNKRDYYGIEGPTVYSEGLYSLREPDHDPLVG